ncbi:MAG: cation transporter, partial [Peptococcaceae bacterium]|nr:cation transporter [Peptococcaceae bacterium]
MKEKENTAGLSILTSLALTLGKVLTGVATNSISIFASGIHSGLDLLASALGYYSASQTVKPADDQHQYGHGKFQNVAAVVEAFFILMVVIMILGNALPAIMLGSAKILHESLGIIVMATSSMINFFIAAILGAAYHKNKSEVFREDYRHLMVNGASAAIVCLGLAAIKFTGLTIIDPLLALMIALVLLKEGYYHLKKSAGAIFDVKLSTDEEGIIISALDEYQEKYVQYHALRTRRSGPDRYIDLHLVVPRDQLIYDVNEVCKGIE